MCNGQDYFQSINLELWNHLTTYYFLRTNNVLTLYQLLTKANLHFSYKQLAIIIWTTCNFTWDRTFQPWVLPRCNPVLSRWRPCPRWTWVWSPGRPSAGGCNTISTPGKTDINILQLALTKYFTKVRQIFSCLDQKSYGIWLCNHNKIYK